MKVKKNNYKLWEKRAEKITNGSVTWYFSKIVSRYYRIFNRHLECDICSTRISDKSRQKCPTCNTTFAYYNFAGMQRLRNGNKKYYISDREVNEFLNSYRAHRDE